MEIKSLLKREELIHPLIFIGLNFLALLVEFIMLGEFYVPMNESASQFFKVFYSGRSALISAISIYISAAIVIIAVALKAAYFLLKVLFVANFKSTTNGKPISEKHARGNREISKAALMVLFLVIALVYWLFSQYLDLIQGIGLKDKIIMFGVIFINSILVFRLGDNILILSKSILILIGSIFIIGPLTLLISWDIVRFHNYIAAFGILLMEAASYIYVFIKVKPSVDDMGYSMENDPALH